MYAGGLPFESLSFLRSRTNRKRINLLQVDEEADYVKIMVNYIEYRLPLTRAGIGYKYNDSYLNDEAVERLVEKYSGDTEDSFF